MGHETMKIKPSYFRNLIFGSEDSLVSTVGVLFGVATATQDKKFVVLTGLVVVAVEALSMGAGSFLSETSTQEVAKGSNEDIPILDGLIMFLAYLLSGFIPLAPYIALEVDIAKYVSIALSIIALFILGYIPAKRTESGFRMAFVAGMAILIGFIIAHLTNSYL